MADLIASLREGNTESAKRRLARRDGAADITARRAGACANPIAPEQRAHNDLANSSQLPLRPDLESI